MYPLTPTAAPWCIKGETWGSREILSPKIYDPSIYRGLKDEFQLNKCILRVYINLNLIWGLWSFADCLDMQDTDSPPKTSTEVLLRGDTFFLSGCDFLQGKPCSWIGINWCWLTLTNGYLIGMHINWHQPTHNGLWKLMDMNGGLSFASLRILGEPTHPKCFGAQPFSWDLRASAASSLRLSRARCNLCWFRWSVKFRTRIWLQHLGVFELF